MTELTDLIDALEKLTKPSRDVDAKIYLAVHGSEFTDEVALEMIFESNGHPAYTASIDAAMTLTDPESFVTIDRYVVSGKPEQMTWRVWIKKMVGDLDGDGPCGLQKSFSTGPTMPIALCIASLRALEGGKKS